MQTSIQKLSTIDAEAYRDLRLEGLAAHPEAFGASFEDEAVLSVDDFAQRLEQGNVFGARCTDTNALVGAVGLRISTASKTRHKGAIWGMYVRPQTRGSGIGAALIKHALDYAKPLVEEVTIIVGASNIAAHKLYIKMGFEQYGFERRALKIGRTYYDEVLMALVLNPPTGQ
ncbi:GNAT family N-acetyltransferase [Agrobacterium sp. lyk4-40-TYG-31]|uniref:GNAT family N-acetyltransferase n=1 Tax=Agrobacterium sp. lyk4-40-TYG-31 TaxID=3040276 RepID=UPI00254D62B0|nr:GNAT family N-acetyltransferase [Agrobacterium sp. lyk4-40-TYG-31]